MRVPLFKPYRMFPELDALTDSECERYVRRVRANMSRSEGLAPVVLTVVLAVGWPVVWVLLAYLAPIGRYVPLPRTGTGAAVLLVATTVLFAAAAGLVVRDLFLYFGLRQELRRHCCPKCRSSLVGLRIDSVGAEPDPAKNFVRCPECGKRHCLLDLGLSPLDLVPFEERGLSGEVGRLRRGRGRSQITT